MRKKALERVGARFMKKWKISTTGLSGILIWLAIMLTVACVVWLIIHTLLAVTAQVRDIRTPIYLLLLLGVILLSPMVYDVVHKKFDIFEARNFVILGFFFFYLLIPLRLILKPKDSFFFSNIPFDYAMREISGATLLAVVGLIFFLVGYGINLKTGIGDRLFCYGNEWNRTKTVLVITAFFMVCLMGYLMFFYYSGGIANVLLTERKMRWQYNYASPYSMFLTKYIIPGILILYASMIDANKKLGLHKILIIFVCLLAVFFASVFVTGSRRNVLTLMLSMVIFWHYFKRSISISKATGIIFGMVAFLFSTTIVRTFMHDYKRLFEQGVGSIVGAPTFELLYITLPTNVYEMFLTLLRQVPESMGFLWGDTYFRLFYIIIPRSIWPDKPGNISQLVPQLLNVDFADRHITTSVTFIGELYWNFGWFGIVVGMLVFGILAKMLYNYVIKHKDSKGAVLIYSVTISYIMELFRGTFHTTTLYYLATVLIPLVVFLRYTSAKKKGLLDQ